MGFTAMCFRTLSNYGRQLAFAIAPIPAYLPQYYALCSSSNDPFLERKIQVHHDKSTTIIGAGLAHYSNSNSNNININNNSNNQNNHNSASAGGQTHNIKESGFSSTSIMLLLISHVLRLQYFLGSAVIHNFSSSTTQQHSADKVHLDLVTQSIVMIFMQLLLLSAVTRRRRMTTKIKSDDDDDDYPMKTNIDGHRDGNANPNANVHANVNANTNTNANANAKENSMLVIPAQLNTLVQHAHAQTHTHTHTNSTRTSSISQTPFIWILHPRQYCHWDTVHQYVELIIAITILLYLFFRIYLYPNDFLQYVSSIKVISVLLESCLAVPQMILNYKLESTEGLSLVMVLGWVLGDLLKLLYFLLGSGVIPTDETVSTNKQSPEDSSSSSEMTTFIFGCVFALVMDIIVGLQVTKYYPSLHMLHVQDRLRRLWVRFAKRVLQMDYVTTSSHSHLHTHTHTHTHTHANGNGHLHSNIPTNIPSKSILKSIVKHRKGSIPMDAIGDLSSC